MTGKSPTDRHWNERAATVEDDLEVNIIDVFQRDLEYDHICRWLKPDMTLLEAGCGNGYSTARFRAHVRHVDAFDWAENMVERARSAFGETNNRFLHDNVLEPRHLLGPYDAAVCVRVLINLRGLEEQRRALDTLVRLVRPDGLLILAEGFQEGFEALTALRAHVGLPPMEPAKINVYTRTTDLLPRLQEGFDLEGEFHLGAYDYLTRVVYPLVAGPKNARHNTVFSERCQSLARAFNPDAFRDFSRMRGFVLRKRA